MLGVASGFGTEHNSNHR